MTPAFADPQAPSRPLHVVSPEGLEAWLDWLREQAAQVA